MRTRYSFLVMIGLVAGSAGSAMAQNPIIQIIHNSPSPGVAVVDIYLNGGATPAWDDLGFRGATNLIDLSPASYTIGIAPGNSTGPGDIIADFGPVDLQAGTQTVVMAAGEFGDDFDLFFHTLNTSAPSDDVGLLAFHGAPDAATMDISLVGGGDLFTGLEYLTFQGYLFVAEDNYRLEVKPAGHNPIGEFLAPLLGLQGDALVVFASGYLDAMPEFGLFAAFTNGVVIEWVVDPGAAVDRSTWGEVKAGYR